MTCPHLPPDRCTSIGVQHFGEERLDLRNCPACGTTLARALCSVDDCPDAGTHEIGDEGERYCDVHAAALVLWRMRETGAAPEDPDSLVLCHVATGPVVHVTEVGGLPAYYSSIFDSLRRETGAR